MTDNYRADIAAAVARMGSRTGAGKELAHLEKRLNQGEQVTAVVAGRHGSGNGVLVLTDARVLFVFEGLIRQELIDLPLAKVAAVEWKTAVNLGTITVLAGSEVEVAGVDKDGGELFVAALKAATAPGSN